MITIEGEALAESPSLFAHWSIPMPPELGGTVVHRQPGGAAAHRPRSTPSTRCRLFLPFADDDPKTGRGALRSAPARRDREIQDPTILPQLRTAH